MRNKPYPYYELQKISNLREMLEIKNAACPDGIAFTYMKNRNETGQKSYKEFYEDVNALGAWICSKGLIGKHIAVIGENSYYWLVAYFAIVNGAGVAVPIDKELPSEEAGELLKRADVSAVFYAKHLEKNISVMQEICACDYYSMADMDSYMEEGKNLAAGGMSDFLNCV